ncbi:hypothetical protein LZZ85_27720 [Terrimonas sp. NA20]|uniref:TIGR02646 family protein n=1 Tax=Terrimonas ginsenosidimutans TaxID=2908004 RepID=A0ABS9L0L7_9BACT|nr:hypothetical protein [Terrimonas ginsenosidimutans]MCG2618123.1 hypothetical protein [Terrimonas ginsenosidimutans]
MKFKQIQGSLFFNTVDKTTINDLKPFSSNEWLGKLSGKPWGARTRRDTLKKKIKGALDVLQGDTCAFCGLYLYETSPAQIEHIAPKGYHPQFMYTNNNLCLACVLCNGFEKKGDIDTISVLNPDYDQCTFTIVHPYKDEPDKHYQIANYSQGGITLHYLTSESKKSRDIFDLEGPKQIRARGKQFMHEELKNDPAVETLLKQILRNKYAAK